MSTLSLRQICDQVAANHPEPLEDDVRQPEQQSLRQPFERSNKVLSEDSLEATRLYLDSKKLGYAEYAPGPNRMQDKKSLRLRFLANENGEVKRPVFIDFEHEVLAEAALSALRERAKHNRQRHAPEHDHMKTRASHRPVENPAPVNAAPAKTEKDLRQDPNRRGLVAFLG